MKKLFKSLWIIFGSVLMAALVISTFFLLCFYGAKTFYIYITELQNLELLTALALFGLVSLLANISRFTLDITSYIASKRNKKRELVNYYKKLVEELPNE